MSNCVRRAQADYDRHAFIGHFSVIRSGLDFDLRADGQLGVLDAGEREFEPVAVGRSGVAAQVEDAVGGDVGAVSPALAVEIHRLGEGEFGEFRRGLGVKLCIAVDQQQALRARQARREVCAAIVIHVAGRETERARRQFRDVLRCIRAAQGVAIENSRAIRVRHHEVEPGGVGLEVETHGVQGPAGGEGEALRFVAETSLAVIAEEAGVVAHQEQVRVVIVIVVQPERFAEGAARQFRLEFELPAGVAVEQGGVRGDDDQIGQAIVIEIAGGDGDDVAEVLQAGIDRGFDAVAKEGCAPVSPGDQAGASTAIQRESDGSRGVAGESGGQLLLAIDGGGQRRRCGRGRRIVDLGKEAPFHVFRHGGAFLLLLQVLKLLQLGGGVFGPVRLAIEAVELKVRRGETGVQRAGPLELGDGGGRVVGQFVQGAKLVVGGGLVGHEARHLLELDHARGRTPPAF